MAKLDTMHHQWVASLSNYNFQLHCRAEMANVDMDALLRVSWPRCVAITMDTYHQVTTKVVQTMQEATFKCLMSPIESYSCDPHMLDPVEDSWQVSCMTTGDWWQTQLANPILREVVTKIQDRTLDQCPFYGSTECKHSKLKKGVLYWKYYQEGVRRHCSSWKYWLNTEWSLWRAVMM